MQEGMCVQKRDKGTNANPLQWQAKRNLQTQAAKTLHFVFVVGPLGVAAYKRKVLEENSAQGQKAGFS